MPTTRPSENFLQRDFRTTSGRRTPDRLWPRITYHMAISQKLSEDWQRRASFRVADNPTVTARPHGWLALLWNDSLIIDSADGYGFRPHEAMKVIALVQ